MLSSVNGLACKLYLMPFSEEVGTLNKNWQVCLAYDGFAMEA